MSDLKIKLENTNYNDLKGAFEELGIPNVFVRGAKKVDLINNAIEVIAKMELGNSEGDAIISSNDDKLKGDVDLIVKVKSEFDLMVQSVVDDKKFWTKGSIDKRIKSLHNVFLQHRGSSKGIDCEKRKRALEMASKIMFD